MTPGSLGEGSPINCFALVTYMPDPLGRFLDRLRRELEPAAKARAHVTLLPPRSLEHPPEEAWRELEKELSELRPFHIELTDIEVFPGTNVIYVAIGEGYQLLEEIHRALNGGKSAYDEPFEYHPHVTLAQKFPDGLEAAEQFARRRWAEFPHSRRFAVESLTFVQNTEDNQWIDLWRRELRYQDESLVWT